VPPPAKPLTAAQKRRADLKAIDQQIKEAAAKDRAAKQKRLAERTPAEAAAANLLLAGVRAHKKR
jgi:hypothetical protein